MTGYRSRILHWLADKLRRFADDIDRPGAPKSIGMSFTFEQGIGTVFRDDGRGCPLWYLGDQDYDRAHDEAGGFLLGAHGNEYWVGQRFGLPG